MALFLRMELKGSARIFSRERNQLRNSGPFGREAFRFQLGSCIQRKEDIPPLVEHFVSILSKKVGKAITSISGTTLKKLQDYSWPGNVRELANVLERAVVTARGPALNIAEHFDQPNTANSSNVNQTLEDVEKEHITRILGQTAWRIEGPSGAARILGLNPSTLRTRMVKLGIQKNTRTSAGSRE